MKIILPNYIPQLHNLVLVMVHYVDDLVALMTLVHNVDWGHPQKAHPIPGYVYSIQLLQYITMIYNYSIDFKVQSACMEVKTTY